MAEARTIAGDAAPAAGPILFDLTASIATSGPPTGIARLETDLFSALVALAPGRIVPIAWSRKTDRHLDLSGIEHPEQLAPEQLQALDLAGRLPPLADTVARPGAQVLMTGGVWARQPAFIASLGRLRAHSGAPLTVLIHDLAQIRLKTLYPAETAAQFERNARRLCRLADRFLVYSQATAADLSAYLDEIGVAGKSIARFPMGSTLDATFARGSSTRPPPAGLEALAGTPFALYVSSIEPRKNHRMLMEAWRRLVATHRDAPPTLLCVGRPVVDGQALIDAVERDADLSPHVRFASGLHDDDLDWCYRNATLTVYPSLHEGWGLPVAEALLYGKVCLTSNVSSMREIAPELTDLIDPVDAPAWAERIAFYFDSPDERKRREDLVRARYAPYPWQAAAADVLDVMAAATPGRVDGLVRVSPNSRLRFARHGQQKQVLVAGWGKAGREGRLAMGERCGIAFHYTGSGASFAIRLWTGSREAARAPGVEVADGTAQVTLNAASNYVDVIVARSAPSASTHLWLSGWSGQLLKRIDVADSVPELDRLRQRRKPAQRRSLLDRIGRFIRARLGRGAALP